MRAVELQLVYSQRGQLAFAESGENQHFENQRSLAAQPFESVLQLRVVPQLVTAGERMAGAIRYGGAVRWTGS